MSDSIKYKITPLAIEDIDSALKYIAENLYNQKAANDLYENIMKGIENACLIPAGYSNCFEYNIDDDNIRKIKVDNYLLIYEIKKEEKQINILRFRYGGMNLKNISLSENS